MYGRYPIFLLKNEVRIVDNERFLVRKCNISLFFVYIKVENDKTMDQEKNILDGLLRNQADAQRRLLQQYGERVFAQIVRIIPIQEDAEEVYQDVFLKVFRNVDSYHAERASLSTWLLRIAYHEALNFVRGKKLPVISFDDYEPSIEKLSEHDVDVLMNRTDEETVLLMEQALQKLLPKEQSLIGMFYYEDLSLKEIAYITDSTTTTIASRLCRIRQKMYHIIKKLKNEREV